MAVIPDSERTGSKRPLTERRALRARSVSSLSAPSSRAVPYTASRLQALKRPRKFTHTSLPSMRSSMPSKSISTILQLKSAAVRSE